MSQKPQSLKQTLQLIADILSFDTGISDALEGRIKTKQVDWERTVTVASQHLVLPAVYCRLQQKTLLEHLPSDLVDYLKALSDLNRDRNIQLLQEAQKISRLLRQHDIDHVFLKGTALLAGNYYTDMAERMVGDIDILIDPDQLKKAFDLLVVMGYSKFIHFNYEVKNYRHMPRQIAEDRLGAIELHGQLLKHGFNQLFDGTSFLSEKQMVNQIPIPSTEHLILNTIYAHQINDNNSFLGRLELKSMYDLLVLGVTEHPQLLATLSRQRHGARFLSLASVWFPALSEAETLRKNAMYRRMYLWSINIPTFGRLYYAFKKTHLNLKERIVLLYGNKSYRQHVLKKLRIE